MTSAIRAARASGPFFFRRTCAPRGRPEAQPREGAMTTIPSYVTTAIPFVNAQPHLGHAFELVLADAVARHQRRRGERVRLPPGTADHSPKNARAPPAAAVDTRFWVARHGARFRALADLLGYSLDDYL